MLGKNSLSPRKRYKITNKMIAKWFKYSSEDSFNSSKAKDKYLEGIDALIKHVEDKITGKIP